MVNGYLDVILVVDLESTCWEGSPPPEQTSEIIEIGLCTVDLNTLTHSEKRSFLVKPVQSEISDFCTELTTLTPDMFAGAGTLADAVKILKKEFRSKDRLTVADRPKEAFTTSGQPLFSRLWGSGYLPSSHQGVMLRPGANPVLYLKNPLGVTRDSRRQLLDTLGDLNQMHSAAAGDPETLARIDAYEMAYSMQTSVPDLTNVSDEPESTFELYGDDARRPGSFAANCLLARRMAQRGVRFIQLFHRGWDQHISIKNQLPKQCRDVDQASAALVKDLKRLDMLDETLVIWGGEFGRTVYSQGELGTPTAGRDHHGRCFSVWMAGGGIKAGYDYGQTDEFAYNIAENPVHIRDLNATILHQLGIDHEQFTFKFRGLSQRLTGVEEARVVKEILA